MQNYAKTPIHLVPRFFEGAIYDLVFLKCRVAVLFIVNNKYGSAHSLFSFNIFKSECRLFIIEPLIYSASHAVMQCQLCQCQIYIASAQSLGIFIFHNWQLCEIVTEKSGEMLLHLCR